SALPDLIAGILEGSRQLNSKKKILFSNCGKEGFSVYKSKSQAATGPNKAPSTALKVIATELIDVSCWPYSKAFAVPMPWAEVPRPMPRPIGESICSHFKRAGPKI